MASGIATLNLTGFEELIKKFERLPGNLQKKYLRPSLRAGAKVIQVAAKQKARKKSGRNARFIKVKALKRSRKSVGVTIQTGTRQELGIPADEPSYYPFSQEFGTKDFTAKPYMRPALIQKRAEATRRIAVTLEKAIKKGESVRVR